MANILENAESIKRFLDDCESGDPLKDFYDEDDLASALITLIRRSAELEAQACELHKACKLLLRCSLPNDISGMAMVDEAREAIAKFELLNNQKDVS